MNGRPFVATIGLILGATQLGSDARATDLVDLIPSLYGGDGITLLEPPEGTDFPSHEAHFVLPASSQINQLNDEIAGEVRPIQVNPSAGGITYEFDPARGTYKQTTDSLGPIVAERPQTLGKGKFSLGMSYTFFSYSRFEGEDLDSIRAVAEHIDVDPTGFGDPTFEFDTIQIDLDIDLKLNILVFAGTYGLTDRLDVGFAVPLVHADMEVEAVGNIIRSPLNLIPADVHRFDQDECENTLTSDQGPCISTADGSETGLGDVFLGAKYHWLSGERYNLAGALTIKLETGDEDNFLGTGSTTVRPFLITSHELTDRATAHLNLGYEFDLGDTQRNVLSYAAGLEVGDETLTGIFDLLGRHETDSDGIGNDLLDAAFGAKWRPTENLILAAKIVIPVNREQGLRSDLISTLAIEYRN